jgi:hypothetical protein
LPDATQRAARREAGMTNPEGREVCLTLAVLLKRGVTPKMSEQSMIPRYTCPEMASIWEARL